MNYLSSSLTDEEFLQLIEDRKNQSPLINELALRLEEAVIKIKS